MASSEAPLAPKPESGNACSNACATLGLGPVVGFTQKLWKDVSHTPYLGCARACVRARMGAAAWRP